MSSDPHQSGPPNQSDDPPEQLISIFDPYPGEDSSEEDGDPPYCLGFDLYYVNIRPEDLPIFETQEEFHRFITNRACGTMEAAIRYQQWWPFNGEGAGDDLTNQPLDAERGYEDLREAYDDAMSQALRARRRGRVCCEMHAALLRTPRLPTTTAADDDEGDGDDDEGDDEDGDKNEYEEGDEDEEGDEENDEEDDEDMAEGAAVAAVAAEVNSNDGVGSEE
jgi:hypothetical protein